MTDPTPTPSAIPPSKPIWTRWWMIVIYVIVGIGIFANLFPADDDADTTAAPTTTVEGVTTTTADEATTSTVTPPTTQGPTTTLGSTTTEAPTTTLPPTTTVPARLPVFGNGIQEVGVDVLAGTYETGLLGGDDFFDTCYWERLSGFSGEFDEIIANNNAVVHDIVEIADSDVAFNNDCGDWYDLEASGNLMNVVPPGKWAVGMQFEAGRYETAGGETCYWERLSGFSGEFDDIIANDLPSGAAIVEISASDVAFNSNGCGEWTLR